MNWKETYTKVFLKELNISINETNVKDYLPLWWKNLRQNGGLRLTDQGLEILEQIGLATYDIPFPKEMPFLTTQVVIFLDNFIDCPYYITKNSIIVTTEKKAVELSLFAGDLRKYGLTKAMSRQKKL